ncbi:MAG TPA: ABC transporter permease subunit [Bryobacteraceae bacterium]|nr:ABC transporter permease subunit [Bryobacteraceae bacterium]
MKVRLRLKRIRVAQTVALVLLALVALASLAAGFITPSSYAEQFRDSIGAPPSHRFPLGTDDLGRDRFARLLYGTRVSLLLAPAAALLSTLLAALIGGLAGYVGGGFERFVTSGIDLFLSLPWLFLLLAARALLPLNTSPVTSVAITFLLLGCLGWATPARIIRAGTRTLINADFLTQARATGISGFRLFWRHLLPNLRPIFLAQFWISVPLFILSEANLGLLGLGVSEPLPSWGSMLRELENYTAIFQNPWMLAPVILLVLVVACLQIVLRTEERIPC